MKPHIEEAWRALRLADRDITAFNVLKESEAHLSVVCFHAQQAVEKALKAVLFSGQIEFRRTHDLTELARLLPQDGNILPVMVAELERLNPFAVTFRYDDLEINVLSIIEATHIVEKIRLWAEEQIRIATDETRVHGAN